MPVLPLGSVSLTSDGCLLQHQIFYVTASHKLNASTTNTEESAMKLFNPKCRKVSSLNREIGHA